MAEVLGAVGSVVQLITAAEQVINYFKDVKDASEQQQQFLQQAQSLVSLLICLRDTASHREETRMLVATGGPLDQLKYALEVVAPKLVKSGSRTRGYSRSLKWHWIQKDVAHLLRIVESSKSSIGLVLANNAQNVSEKILAETATIENNIGLLEERMKDRGIDERRRQEIANWYSKTEYGPQQSDLIRRREKDTGLWLLESVEFKEWIEGPGSTLFLPGIPGAGKSMMAAIVIDHLWSSLPRDASSDMVGVAYIFCNYKKQDEQNYSNLLAALVKQLILESDSVPEPAEALYLRHKDRRTSASSEELFGTLHSIIAVYSHVYLVVDALDECIAGDLVHEQLLDALFKLQSQTDIRLLVTSRFISIITHRLGPFPTIEVKASDHDLRKYLAGCMSHLEKCVKDSTDLQETIIVRIIEAAKGMFLLAQLLIDHLRDKTTPRKVKKALEDFDLGSDALGVAYTYTIDRINSQLPGHVSLAKRAISWIVLAKRQLKTYELQEALAVEPHDSDLDTDILEDIDTIVRVCAGLVVTDEESDIIRLVHYTTQELFLRKLESWNTSAAKEIAETCLTYLCFETFASEDCESSGPSFFTPPLSSWRWKYRLLEYAAPFWAAHDLRGLDELALRFLRSRHHVANAVQVVVELGPHQYLLSSYDLPYISGIHLAAYYGLPGLLASLMKETEPAQFQDSPGAKSPLLYAAARNNVTAAQILLESNNVPAHSQDSFGRTPLWFATRLGHVGILRLLMERGDVDPNPKTTSERIPLHVAVRANHLEVVKILLRHPRVSKSIEDELGRTPLGSAARYGHTDIVKLFFDHHDSMADSRNAHCIVPVGSLVPCHASQQYVDLYSRDDAGCTPVMLASAYGRADVVQLYVNRGDFDIHDKDYHGRTALYLAAKSSGVKPKWIRSDHYDLDGDRDMPLVPEAMETRSIHLQPPEFLQTAKTLINHGADVNTQDERGRSPLSIAATKSRSDISDRILDLLLSRGANVDFIDDYGRTPLSWAATRTNSPVGTQILDLLLKKGANVDSKDDQGRTPLLWAIASGSGRYSEDIISVLLREGADVYSVDVDGRTALSNALTLTSLFNNRAAVTELLRTWQRNADIKYTPGLTVLGHATKVRKAKDDENVEEKAMTG